MLEYSEGVSGLIENGGEWLEVLEKSNASLAEQTRILPALKESMTKLLNIEGSDFDALWGGGFFEQASNINLMRAAMTGDEQALFDLQLATARQLNDFNKGQRPDLLSGLQSHSLSIGTQYRVGDKNTTEDEEALYNRLQNALTMGVSKEALEALGYEIEANGTQLIGYSIAAKGYTQDNIDALEELSKQAIESITPYKEINDQLSAYNRELEKAETLQDRLYGDSQIKALDSEREILKATNKALAEKVEWAKAYQKEYADKLEAKGFGIKFENGYIANYTEIAAGLKNSGRYEDLEELNELVGKYDEHL
jgi:hypothetical protein